MPAIEQALGEFGEGDIKDCCVYGPTGYIEKIASDIAEAFPELEVTIEKAGA